MKPIKLNIKTKSENYPIIIGSNIIKDLALYFNKNSIHFDQCLLIIDKNVPNKMISKLTKSLKKKKISKFIFNANEKNKNINSIHKILQLLLNKNFSRLDCLISIGGGVTGDVGGFAASLYKRGLQFINIPSTLLSQVDSSIGGKTGVNTREGKNLIGTFYQPKIVISDTEFLKSLPKREIICGYGEIFKHSLILNEKEKGVRKILNFGHTFAHAYEATLGYSKKLNHGEAVILGIVTALKFSLNIKLIKIKEYNKIIKHIHELKLPSNIKAYFSNKNLNKILTFMIKDKKNITKKINLILLKKIGSTSINGQFNSLKIKTFLKNELTDQNL
jgi:3-dehydroquinate synthetase